MHALKAALDAGTRIQNAMVPTALMQYKHIAVMITASRFYGTWLFLQMHHN